MVLQIVLLGTGILWCDVMIRVGPHWRSNKIRAETNTRFVRIFARLHSYSNTKKVFGYTTNDFGVVILAYLVKY